MSNMPCLAFLGRHIVETLKKLRLQASARALWTNRHSYDTIPVHRGRMLFRVTCPCVFDTLPYAIRI